jgi:ArsR family transcriptional regulator, arsenate/arsenite/antimonite-responsive transcriptional repressor
MDARAAIDAFAALAQDTRLATFRLLVEAGPAGLPAGDIARRLGVPHNTLSTHLATLHRAGLVVARRESRSVIYVADMAGMRAVIDFLLRDCCQGHPELCLPEHEGHAP